MRTFGGGTRRRPQAAGSVTTDVWVRWVVGWDLAFCLMLVIAAFRVLTAGQLAAGERWLAVGLLALLASAYALAGRRPGQARRRRMNAYLCVAIPALALLLWLDPGLAILLFIIYPQVWMYCESRRTAVALTVAVTVSAAAGFAAGEGWQPEAVREIGLQMLVSLLFSLLLGLWISGVIEQSKDRAGLIAQLEATRSELAEVNHAQGVTAERERMAREIHDTLAQGFTSVVMLAQAASAGMQRDPAAARARLGTIEDVARENLAEARALVAAFSPVGLDGVTLPDAVLRLAQRFGTETGLVVDVEVAGELAGLGRRREVVLLRAAQEALTNVRRHAQAQQVTVRLVADDEGARVEVDDDGVGFAVSGTTGTGGLGTAAGFGLAGMRGRVHEAGGEVDVASEPGRGTRVTVRVP